ncbi:MAG: tetratricopeptide repeat protein [Planctomycetes bacterium]|nr:tetratricopeptide repeat protein [Planctomycetota bacterium]
MNASTAGKSHVEKQRLFDRFEKAIEKCATQRGGLGAAFDLCVTQYRLFPNERKAAINLALMYSAMRKQDESVALLEEALSKKDEFFEDKDHLHLERTHRSLGAYRLSQNDAEKAIRHLEKARALDPKDAHAYFLLGQSYGLRSRTPNSKGDREKAIACFKRGFELGPKLGLPEDYARYASLLLQEGDHKEAVDMLKSGIRRFPAVPAFYFNLAQYVRASGDATAAYYLYYMATLVSRPGDMHGKLAAEEIEKTQATAKKEKDSKAYEGIRQVDRAANLMGQAGKAAEAVDALRKALKADGTNQFVIRYLLGKALTNAKEYAKATSVLNTCIKERPWFAPAYVELGRVFELQGNHQQAMKVWVRALEIQPQNQRVQEIWDQVTDQARQKALDKLKEPAQPQ